MTAQHTLEWLLKRDRVVVGVCLLAVTAVAAIYILAGAGMGMTAMQMTVPMQHMGAVAPQAWNLPTVLMMFLMWWVMMIAMMLPSAAPTILLAAAINRRSDGSSPPYGNTAAFVLGYLLAWALFSACAVAIQWQLEQSRMLSMHMESVSVPLNAALLIAAGAWQFTSLKESCLQHCRSPADFLVRYRKPGTTGAMELGIRHGMFCLGCCWFLMALLFVGGVMNLYWIVGLAVYVYCEKVLSAGPLLGKIAGACLVMTGFVLVLK